MLIYYYINICFSLFFLLLSFIKSILFLQLTLVFKSTFSSRGHLSTFLDSNEFENCFKDSGYWDFFLLTYFDYSFRVFWIFSLIKASEFSITEKASWLVFGAIFNVWKTYFYMELFTITEFFFFCAVALVLNYFLFFFFFSLMFFI